MNWRGGKEKTGKKVNSYFTSPIPADERPALRVDALELDYWTLKWRAFYIYIPPLLIPRIIIFRLWVILFLSSFPPNMPHKYYQPLHPWQCKHPIVCANCTVKLCVRKQQIFTREGQNILSFLVSRAVMCNHEIFRRREWKSPNFGVTTANPTFPPDFHHHPHHPSPSPITQSCRFAEGTKLSLFLLHPIFASIQTSQPSQICFARFVFQCSTTASYKVSITLAWRTYKR